MFFKKVGKKRQQNHRAPGMLYKCYKVYKDDIKFKIKKRAQKAQKDKNKFFRRIGRKCGLM